MGLVRQSKGANPMLDFFLKHPRSVGETYVEHMEMAAGFGVAMILGGLACLVHALVPAWFETTGSRIISHLHTRMVLNRRRKAPVPVIDYAI